MNQGSVDSHVYRIRFIFFRDKSSWSDENMGTSGENKCIYMWSKNKCIFINDRWRAYLVAKSRRNILVEYSQSNHRKWCEEDVIAWHEPIIICSLAREWCICLKQEERETKCDVLVEEIAYLQRNKRKTSSTRPQRRFKFKICKLRGYTIDEILL